MPEKLSKAVGRVSALPSFPRTLRKSKSMKCGRLSLQERNTFSRPSCAYSTPALSRLTETCDGWTRFIRSLRRFKRTSRRNTRLSYPGIKMCLAKNCSTSFEKEPKRMKVGFPPHAVYWFCVEAPSRSGPRLLPSSAAWRRKDCLAAFLESTALSWEDFKTFGYRVVKIEPVRIERDETKKSIDRRGAMETESTQAREV